MVEACEAEKPCRGSEGRPAFDEVAGHDDLVAVEDDPRDVAAEEDADNTENDESKIDFSLDRLTLTTMRKPRRQFL